jgi:hypothetical protein
MGAFIPPAIFLIAVALALIGVEPPASSSEPPMDEALLLWTLYLSFGWGSVGGSVFHTLFARQTAKSIGWETNGFQYEVGFANLAIGLTSIYAVHSGTPDAWVAAGIAGGTFLVLAGLNHIREIFTDRNYAPGNTAILISDLGAPILVFATLLSTGAI